MQARRAGSAGVVPRRASRPARRAASASCSRPSAPGSSTARAARGSRTCCPTSRSTPTSIAFIKSSKTIGATHDISILKLNTGDLNPGPADARRLDPVRARLRQSDLPPYVVLYNGDAQPDGGSGQLDSGFLPRCIRARRSAGPSPILYLDRPELARRGAAARQLRPVEAPQRADLGALSRRHRAARAHELLRARVPHGIGRARGRRLQQGNRCDAAAVRSRRSGRRPTTARPCCARGAWSSAACASSRSISGPLAALNDETPDTNWDAHQDLDIEPRRRNAQSVDKPIAGLLADLKARGLLDSTLVVWTSEFGCTPYGQSGNGRDHNPWGYTQWLAGGGVRRHDVRRDGRDRPQVGRHEGRHATTCTRRCCTCWGLDHLRHAVHAQRPRGAADRRLRRSHQGSAGVRLAYLIQACSASRRWPPPSST